MLIMLGRSSQKTWPLVGRKQRAENGWSMQGKHKVIINKSNSERMFMDELCDWQAKRRQQIEYKGSHGWET